MIARRKTQEEVLRLAKTKLGTDDKDALLNLLAQEVAHAHHGRDISREMVNEEWKLQETVIASLVAQLGGEARIKRADLEGPPNVYKDDDPVNGDWIYRTWGPW